MSTCKNYKYVDISETTLLQPHLTVFRMKSKKGLGLPICQKDHKYSWFVENKWLWNTEHQWINHWFISVMQELAWVRILCSKYSLPNSWLTENTPSPKWKLLGTLDLRFPSLTPPLPKCRLSGRTCVQGTGVWRLIAVQVGHGLFEVIRRQGFASN